MSLEHAPFPSGTDTLEITDCSASSMIVSTLNIGCSYATFDNITFDGLDPSEYTLTSTHYCGCIHVPDSSFITLMPKQSGIRNMSVHFHYTDDEFNQIDTSMIVTLDVKPGGVSVPVGLTLGSGSFTARAGDTIEIPVYLSSDTSIKLGSPIQMSLPFALDTNVLHPLGFIPAIPGLSLADSMKLNGNILSVELQSMDSLTLDGKILVGKLRCVVYLADTLQTSVSLVGASINSGDARCLALSTDAGAVSIAITGCGDSTLLRYMKNGTLPFSIERISPNPANDLIDVQLRNTVHQALDYELDDALGVRRTRGTVTSDRFTLDTHGLANGIYYLRVMAASSSRAYGIPDTRTIVIEH
jgi:hypothetical protein